MRIGGSINILDESEIKLIIDNAFNILSKVGFIVKNERLLKLLAEYGADVEFSKELSKFPVSLLEKFIQESNKEFDKVEGLEVSCLLPYGERTIYSNGIECTAGTYPQYWLTLESKIIPHTNKTIADATRLADYLSNFNRLGVMGIPSDVPAQLIPLYMRLNAWKYAEKKLSGCGEVYNPDLIPYIIEMGRIMADYKKVPLRRYTFAEVSIISPLKFTKIEAGIFVNFWESGLICGISSMLTTGGSAPATLASTISLIVAESLFINILYRLCYNLKKLYLQCNSGVMDMKKGSFVFGRPERALITLAVGQIAKYLNAALWTSAVYPDTKLPSTEAGMQSAFNTIPSILAGSLGLECFGLLSGAEMGSPVQLVIDNEYCGALKHFARGFQVNEQTLAFDLIKEIGHGGIFIGTLHTAENYRKEHWQPEIFTREALNSWLGGDRKIDVDKAREICEYVFKEYHPQGIDEKTEKSLLEVIKKAEKHILK